MLSVFMTSVQSVLTIVLMMAAGYFARSRGWIKEGFSNSAKNVILKVALPCAVFNSMMEDFKPSQLSKLSVGLLFSIISILVSMLIGWIIAKVFRVRPERMGLLITGITFGNTVFIGMPLNVALFGQGSIAYLLVYYIVNTALLWTSGVWIIAHYDPTNKTGENEAKFNWSHLLPAPLWGFIVAIPFIYIHALNAFLKNDLKFVMAGVKDLGGLVTPLSLIYIGLMIYRFGFKSLSIDKDTILALIGRFIISALIMAGIIVAGAHMGLGLSTNVFRETLIVQAATPTFAVMPILADQYHSDIKYATNIVTWTSILFIVVTPLIMVAINYL